MVTLVYLISEDLLSKMVNMEAWQCCHGHLCFCKYGGNGKCKLCEDPFGKGYENNSKYIWED